MQGFLPRASSRVASLIRLQQTTIVFNSWHIKQPLPQTSALPEAQHRVAQLLTRTALLHAPSTRCHSTAAPTSTATTPSHSTSTSNTNGSGKSRAYPDEPRIGVGVIVFRRPVAEHEPRESAEVLLIRRAKEPAKGQYCFPGGSLELGESIASCAAREILEETGLHIRNQTGLSCEGFSKQLLQPTPFAAVDAITHDKDGQIKFHYVVIEVAAMALDGSAVPVAADDVDDVHWCRVADLRQVENLTANCARLAEEAVHRFDLSQ